MDPRFLGLIKSRIAPLVVSTRIQFQTEDVESIVNRVDAKLNYQFPPNMPEKEQLRIRTHVRGLIRKQCEGFSDALARGTQSQEDHL